MYAEDRYLPEFSRYLTEFGRFSEFRPRAGGGSRSESDSESDSVSESDSPGPRPPRLSQPSQAEAQNGWPQADSEARRRPGRRRLSLTLAGWFHRRIAAGPSTGT